MTDHPIRRPEVQDEIERATRIGLADSGGTGRVLIEFDFKEWRAISFRPIIEGRRRALTTKEG